MNEVNVASAIAQNHTLRNTHEIHGHPSRRVVCYVYVVQANDASKVVMQSDQHVRSLSARSYRSSLRCGCPRHMWRMSRAPRMRDSGSDPENIPPLAEHSSDGHVLIHMLSTDALRRRQMRWPSDRHVRYGACARPNRVGSVMLARVRRH